MSRVIDVCAEGEIPEGGPYNSSTSAAGSRSPCLLVDAASYYAIEDVCTHDDGPLAEGEARRLSDHLSPATAPASTCVRAQALTLPAYRPVETFEVRVENGRVLLVV